MRRRINRRKSQKHIIIFSIVGLICFLGVGYAAFSTNFVVSGTGIINDVKYGVDSKVPLNELLFWGQADNVENTNSILKDKSGNNNDGNMFGFDNTSSSGFNNGSLEFDGVDDYVNLGFDNYNFQNSISYVIYVKINEYDDNNQLSIFGNWESAGGGIETVMGNNRFLQFDICDGEKYVKAIYEEEYELEKYYTLIGTFDGSVLKFFVDGLLVASSNMDSMKPSLNILLGADPSAYVGANKFVNMSLKEVLLYDRALTDEEAVNITLGFNKKYN